MKLGLQLGYWAAQPPTNHANWSRRPRKAGFDTVFTAEAWGSDAYTPLAWWVVRPRGCDSARRHPAVRTHADRVRDGGADVGSPLRRQAHPRPRRIRTQVVEGWYGQKFSESRWPAPASTSTSCARSGHVRHRAQRWAALSAAADRRGHWRASARTSSRSPIRCARTFRSCWVPRGEERRARGGDLRRLAAHLLLAADRRHVTTSGSTRDSPGRCPAYQGDLRDLRDGAGGRDRRPARDHGADEAAPRAVHGRDGRRGHQLPRRRLPQDGLLRRGRRR